MRVSDSIKVHYTGQAPPRVCRTIAEVDVPGCWAVIGLGLDLTFVMHSVEPHDGEYYMTAGDNEAGGSVDFYGWCEHTPYSRLSWVVRRRRASRWRSSPHKQTDDWTSTP